MALPDDIVKEATTNFAEFTVNQITVFGENMQRAQTLIRIYKNLAEAQRDKAVIHYTDILRSAVIFMHAALEELIRSLIIVTYANAPQIEIDKVPLFSQRRSRQAEKFLLGALIEHKHLTVDQIIQKSVESYFQNQTFNNRADLARAMEIIGLKKEAVKNLLPTLDVMLDRRHQIVHRVDRPKSKDNQWIRATSLSPRHVEKWAITTLEFGSHLITSAGFHKHLSQLIKVKR